MKIGLISDTHGFIDESIFEYFKECHEIWHLGDFGPKVYDVLNNKFTLRGVYGNIDDAECKLYNPEYQLFELEGISFLMLHIGGYPNNYTMKAKSLIQDLKPDIFLTGHSHICKVMRDDKNDLIHINPGAAGNQGFHKVKTIMRFEIVKSKLTNLQVIELGSRTSSTQNYITML